MYTIYTYVYTAIPEQEFVGGARDKKILLNELKNFVNNQQLLIIICWDCLGDPKSHLQMAGTQNTVRKLPLAATLIIF